MLPLVNPKSNNSELGLFVDSHAVTGNSFAIFFHHMFISYHILLHNSIIVPNSTKSKMYLFFYIRFDAIVSADAFENLKPAPDIFIAASKSLNVPPSEVFCQTDYAVLFSVLYV